MLSIVSMEHLATILRHHYNLDKRNQLLRKIAALRVKANTDTLDLFEALHRLSEGPAPDVEGTLKKRVRDLRLRAVDSGFLREAVCSRPGSWLGPEDSR